MSKAKAYNLKGKGVSKANAYMSKTLLYLVGRLVKPPQLLSASHFGHLLHCNCLLEWNVFHHSICLL